MICTDYSNLYMNDAERERLIRVFVHDLGWPKPRRFVKLLGFDKPKSQEMSTVWYESGEIGNNRTDSFLQVSELGNERNTLLCSAAIYAPRFRVCTGWHSVQLNASSPKEESKRLAIWLHRSNIVSYRSRRAFRRMHPEIIGYSWKTIRDFGPPYLVQLQVRKRRKVLVQYMSAKCKQFLSQDSPRED